jgi:hypothetical protein
VINVGTEMVAVMTAVVVAMREESKEGINQAKIGTVLNAEIAIFHSVKTVTAVKHLDQVLAVQALAVMKDMVAVMTAEVVMVAVMTAEVVMVAVMTAEVVMVAVMTAEAVMVAVMTAEVVMVAVMTAEAVMVAVILIGHQTEMVQITVMTGNAQSAKIIISLSAQNVIAAV